MSTRLYTLETPEDGAPAVRCWGIVGLCAVALDTVGPGLLELDVAGQGMVGLDMVLLGTAARSLDFGTPGWCCRRAVRRG